MLKLVFVTQLPRAITGLGKSLVLAIMCPLAACDLGPPECAVEYELEDDWGGGFRASIQIENLGDEPLENWRLAFPTAPSQRVVALENAELVPSELRTIMAARPGTEIAAGESHSLQLVAEYSGPRQTPAEFRVNGKLCRGGRVETVSFTDLSGQRIDILIAGNPSSSPSSTRQSWPFAVGSEVAQTGLVEIQGGLARFFVEDAPWSDLQVESPGTSRLVRMRRVRERNEYLIFGLNPGDSIRYRFLVGLSGQAWTPWRETSYSGLDGELPGPDIPRVEELENGELRFSLSGHPWAEVHTRIADEFLARRLTVRDDSRLLVITGLHPGDRIDYRWVVGTAEAPGQFDTDWSSHVYSGSSSDFPVSQQTPSVDSADIDSSDGEPNRPEPLPNDTSSADEADTSESETDATDPSSEFGPGQNDPANDSWPPTTSAAESRDLYTFEADTLYLIGEANSEAPGALSFSPGASGRFDRTPANRQALVYQIHGLHGTYDPSEGEQTNFELWMDGWLTGVGYLEARVRYDFEGDGNFDREEVFTAAPAHALRGLDLYDSSTFPLLYAAGEYRDLQGGTVRLELTNPHGLEAPDLFTDAAPRELSRSQIEIPFDLFETVVSRPQPEKPAVSFPESLLCPAPGADPRCGAAFDPAHSLSSNAIESALQRGHEAFRTPTARGACAGCHVPDAFDLAVIGYSDQDIRRRALEHVSESQAEDIIGLVHAQRQNHELTRLLHPARFRPLQPGYEPLPGATPQNRDLAFLEYLRDEVGLLLVTDTIDSRSKALEAERQLLELDLERLRIGVRLDRWSEDDFHGLSHLGQDPLDGSGRVGQSGSVAEWLPNMASTPTDETLFYELFDQYASDPTDRNFWRFYDSIRDLTQSHESISNEADTRAFEWMRTKYEAIQVFGHMLRGGTLDYPDRAIDQREHDLITHRDTALARNPIWRVGDLIRQHPLHCNHPDGCTRFPEFVRNETDPGKLELQSQLLERAWFWAGWMLDPSLLSSDESFPTVSGDYFYPLHQGHWGGHYAFIVAKMSAEKANAVGWEKAFGPGVSGHGKWASIRPFLVYKHSEFQRPMFAPSDPRHRLQKQLLTNAARMWIYLVHDDLERTEEAFDRQGTAKAVNFARLNWLDSVDPGGPRADIERIFDEITQMLSGARELRQPHHTDDLYDYLPVADVPLD